VSDSQAPDVRMPPTNRAALEAFLSAHPAPAPQAALARSLAAAIDAAPDVGLAALAKEYRALLKDLAGDADAADPFERLYAEMGDAT
jgi:hypothetical protein